MADKRDDTGFSSKPVHDRENTAMTERIMSCGRDSRLGLPPPQKSGLAHFAGPFEVTGVIDTV
ncbi:MAG: hypothetical protein ACK4GG_07905 [Sphingomonas sp.]